MKTAIRLMAVAAGLLAAQVAMAQAPAGSTGQCKDGTYSTAASKQGACQGTSGREGVVRGGSSGTQLLRPQLRRRLRHRQQLRRLSSGSSGCTCSSCDGPSHEGLSVGESCGDAAGGGWRSRPGVGEYGQQCLSLLRDDVLRQDEGRGRICLRPMRRPKALMPDHGQALHEVDEQVIRIETAPLNA